MNWTQAQDEWLIANYAERPNKELAEWLHRSERAINARAHILGLRKSPEFAEHQRRKGQFKKGDIPFNKGKPMRYWMSEEAQERSAKGRFKPGEVRDDNPLLRPLLYECVRVNHGTKYIYIKVEHGKRMIPKQRRVWQQAHGPIPKGYCIQFKDGNTLNCSLDNLYIISRSRQLVMNRHVNQSPERLAEIKAKTQATRNAGIRRDRLRLKWGLEPEGKLVKRIPK